MKRIHQLTDLSCEKARPTTTRRELPDGGGLYLVIHPSGARTWAVRYRQEGRTRKLTIPGSYPSIGLKTARKLARDALERVAAGADPAGDKIAARNRPSSKDLEFSTLAALFLDRWLTKSHQRPRARTIEENARLLGLARKDGAWGIRPTGPAARWRDRRVSNISRADVVDVLDALVAEGVPVKANHTRAALHLFFGWCMRRGVLENNPCAAVDKPAAQRSRDRVLSDSELALFWQAADKDPVFGPLYKLLALTGQRRDEARGATWDEIDLENGVWTLPAARTKNGRQHTVPLSPPAVALLSALPRIGRRPSLVFTTNGETMLSGLSRAKSRLDARMLALACESNPRAEISPFVLHDLRRTCATGLQRLGIALPVIEKILNHTSGSFAGVVGVYQRHDFAAERRTALNAWGSYIEAIATSATYVIKAAAE